MRDKSIKNKQLAKERAITERKQANRRETGSALIVCEGECTEPYYLNGLLHHLGINSASVEIIQGQAKSNAVAVVNRARERFNQAPRDRIFVLIDAEQDDLNKALNLCNTPLQRSNKKKDLSEIRIEPIISTPCFEVWLLLHFRFCDQPFATYDNVLPILQKELSNYTKSDRDIFTKVGGAEGLQRALQNAPRLRDSINQTGATSPSTYMDSLVVALQDIAPKD